MSLWSVHLALYFNFLFHLIAGFKNANYVYEKPMYFSVCAMKQ